MRIAVLADLHANLPALGAVLSAIRRAQPDCIVCLGDIVGYGAEPEACIEMMRSISATTVLGNHDADVVNHTEAPGTNPQARLLHQWTRSQLSASAIAYLRSLPPVKIEAGEFIAVHGCYLNETHVTGYVTSTMLEANLRAIATRPEWPRLALCGHTHAPLCGWLEGEHCTERNLQEAVYWPKNARAVLLNPGSVGQPRDGDPRASFAVVDTVQRRIEIQRLDYEIERAAQAISAAGLPVSLAERLWQGR